MVKRPHSTKTKLGAGEFAAILNGDNGRPILAALQSFTGTVQRERHTSLHADSDVDEDTDDDENNLVNVADTSNKRLKEEWMNDSKDYRVPFVGTSIAKGETGSVVTGIWPTGLLEAYLKQSPFAMELIGNDSLIPPAGRIHKRLLRDKEGKLSFAIHKAYLKAVSELMTAGISFSTLQRENALYSVHERNIDTDFTNQMRSQYDGPSPPFLSKFSRDRFPAIIDLLLSETGQGNGKKGSASGIGTLAPYALRIITNVAQTSPVNARLVVQALDNSVHESVFRILLREPRKATDGIGEQEAQLSTDRLKLQYRTRSNCIRLAITLLQTRDRTIVSYISTIGSKERKNNPGILYLACRYGLQDSRFNGGHSTPATKSEDEYLNSVSILLQALSAILLKRGDEKELLSRRAVADLLGAATLQNIAQIVVNCAPSLESFEKVLNGEEKRCRHATVSIIAGTDARKLLFLLLASETESPFLGRITYKEDDKLSSIYISFIVKVLHQLSLFDSSSVQKFVIYCICKSPPLLPVFFRGMQLPDVKKFQFLARLRLIGNIIKLDPAPSLYSKVNDKEIWSQREIDKVLLTVLPPKMNKQTLSRALQCSNALIVAESIKIIILAMERVFQLSKDCNAVARTFVTRLPDIQTILAIRSKYDPFVNPSGRNIILNGLLCRVLSTISKEFPDIILATNFDWIKLLPEPISLFRKATLAQLQIVQVLGEMLRCKMGHSQESSRKPSPRTCRILLEVVVSASQESVYNAAREIAKESLYQFIELNPKERNEEFVCLQQEISLWIDTIQPSLLSEFQELLEKATNHSSIHKLTSIQILNKMGIRRSKAVPYCFSLILSTSLLQLNSFSDDFAKLIYHISSRCLLFHSDPLPLAGLIVNACNNVEMEHNALRRAMESYSRLLINVPSRICDVGHKTELLSRGKELSELVLNSTESNPQTQSCSVIILRRALQMVFLFGEFGKNGTQLLQGYLESIRTMVQFLVRQGCIEPISSLLTHPALTCGHLPRVDSAVFQMISLVCSESKHGIVDTFQKDILKMTEQLKHLDANPPSPFLFNLMKVWLLQPLIDSPIDGFIEEMVRSASFFYSRDTNLCKLYQWYALDWIGAHQQHMFCEQTVWEAWKSSTDNSTVLSKINVEFVLAISHALCEVEGKSEASLCCNIKRVGTHEFVGRCLHMFKIAIKFGYTSEFRQSSLLSKAIQVGCLDIVPSILLLATLCDKEIGDLDFLLLHYRITASDLQAIRKYGLLDNAITSIAKSRGDELVQGSLGKLINSAKDSDRISNILREAIVSSKSHTPVNSLPPCNSLLTLMVSPSDKKLQYKEFSFFSFLVLVNCIPKALKNAFSMSEGEDDSGIVEGEDNSISFSETILGDTINLVQDSGRMWVDLPLIDANPVIRACLKHGIFCYQGRLARLANSCVKLVRLLLILYSNQQTSMIEEGNTLSNPNPIWCMIQSHSKFNEAILCKEDRLDTEGASPRHEIVKLLICCISLSDEEMPIEEQFLNTLLTAYSGGTTQFDKMLRYLLYYIEQSTTLNNFVFGNEICQRVLGASSQVIESKFIEQGWDFLASAIDLGRVHNTLSQFPYEETVSPPPLQNIDPLSISNDEDAAIGERYDLWRGRGADQRYDPSFLAPQILAGLESLLMEDAEIDSASKFPQFVQRLCDRGALGICLASLCSLCKSVRKSAFAALCLFHQAIDSEAAKAITTWRDRSQLHMLLSSVQRGFALHMEPDILSDDEVPPRLATLSAIFLAKASLILSKPGHAIYTAINKYFLRLDKAHGAYDDMTRLPSFIPLFCSHSSDHSKQERNFAIKCLRDSCLDVNSFRMVSACHAPDYLMTAASQKCLDDSERQMIVEALSRMLQCGEQFAARSLLGRAGLFSWLRVLVSAQVIGLNQSLLDLIKVAVQQAVKYMPNEQEHQVILDLRNLLAPLTMAKPSNGLCEIFCFVAESLSNLDYNQTLSPCGVSVPNSLALLTFNSECPRLLKNICTAPIDDEANPEECFNYCRSILRQTSHLQGCSVRFVMQRIHQLASLDRLTSQEERNNWSEILQLVLVSHAYATSSCRDIYHQCLRTILAHTPNDDKCSCIGAQLVTQDDDKH